MLTDRTREAFASDMQPPAWFGPNRRAAYCARTRARHAEYELRFDAALAALGALQPAGRRYAAGLLQHLNRPGTLGGTLEYIETVERLAKLGIGEASNIFHHDRAALARIACDDAGSAAA
jgi:hypothetical protein